MAKFVVVKACFFCAGWMFMVAKRVAGRVVIIEEFAVRFLILDGMRDGAFDSLD